MNVDMSSSGGTQEIWDRAHKKVVYFLQTYTMVLACFSCGLKLHLLGAFSVQKPRIEAGSAPLCVTGSLGELDF